MIEINEEIETVKPGVLAKLRGWFLTGLLVTAPVLLTVYITWATIQLIDGQVSELVPGFKASAFGEIPGVGLVVGLVIITIIGAIAAGFFGRWLIRLGESLLNRMPVVRTIYSATKQILETVISTQSDAFRDVVLVEYPRRGLWVIGFVTGSTKGEVSRRMSGNNVNVFIPTTPNPTSGFLLFCPKEELIYMDMSVESAVKLVVSGGIITPPDKNTSSFQPPAGDNVTKASTQSTAPRKVASRKAAAKTSAANKVSMKKAARKPSKSA